MTQAFSLQGRRALVTGGSKGIGLGIARGLTEAGAEVILVARDAADLEAAKEQLSASGKRISAWAFDMGDIEAVPAWYASVIAKEGPVDVLVNNAGINLRAPAHELPMEQWDTVIRLNLTAVFALSQAFAKERIATHKGGKIINIASLMSEAARKTTAAYTASKGGIRQLTKALAVDWAPYGINVNAIGPGYIRTPLTKPLYEDQEFDAWVKNRTPLGRWGTPDDLAHTAVFLASAASDFITGQVIYVDGGWLSTF